ncbi:uncharacterized protein LOC144158182 isoform X9 [Haemaphysalis longicornis]
MSMVGARSNDASCSQYTQTIITTSAIGTQCCLRFFMGASCQTEDKFPETHGKAWKGFPAALLETVPEVDSAQASALKNFPAPRDGEDIAAKAGPHICSCNLHSGNTSNASFLQGLSTAQPPIRSGKSRCKQGAPHLRGLQKDVQLDARKG